MLRKSFLVMLLFSLSFSLSMTTFAQVPHLINYQGMLTDASDNPLDGNFTIVFRIYNSSSGGTSLWQETQNVEVKKGIFNVLLGSSKPLTTTEFDGKDKYLSIQVGSDSEMANRKRLVSVGYSLLSEKADEAGDADKLDGFHASSFVRTVDGAMPNSNGNVDLESGTDISVGPGLTPNSIRISYTGTSGGDNLGNHTAEENIKLGGFWLSSDGGSEGIQVSSVGDITCSRKLLVGSPSTSSGPGDVVADDQVKADEDVIAGDDVLAGDCIIAGSPSSSYGAGDIVATGNLIADAWVNGNAFHAQGDIISDNGYVRAGSPSTNTVGAGDIGATDDLIADDDVLVGDHVQAEIIHARNFIRSGTPSSSYSTGDITSTDDLIADDDLICGGTKSAFVNTSTHGTRLFYSEEATEVYFFDRGHGRLINGQAVIELDPIFLEAVTIDTERRMMVQVTLTADCNGVFVNNKTATSFTVKELMNGTSNATFDWEVCAKRKDHENKRLDIMTAE